MCMCAHDVRSRICGIVLGARKNLREDLVTFNRVDERDDEYGA